MRLGIAMLGASAMLVAACGSASTSTHVTTTVTRTAAAPKAPRLAPASAASSAPAYCKALAGSAVGQLSTALVGLAENPQEPKAHATIQQAASALRDAATSAPADSQHALSIAATALDTLDTEGLRAATAVNAALQAAGSALQTPCGYPTS